MPSQHYRQYVGQIRANAQQWEAYTSSGDCIVLAGPGSGKTKVLTMKVARMMDEDIQAPRGLACLTYSNECARELERRLRRLEVQPGGRLFVGTVHSFCFLHLVLPYAQLAGHDLPDDVVVAGRADQTRVFTRALESVVGLDERVSDWQQRCSVYRRRYLDRDSNAWANTDPDATGVILAYEAGLRREGLIDFDDMVVLGYRLLAENLWVHRAVVAKFPILVVDEYQDLGTPLHLLAQRLCFSDEETRSRLFAVGDPDQSIYGFNGARPGLLRELSEREDVQKVQLRLNYRSKAEIVRASELALNEDRGYQAESGAGGVVEFHHREGGITDQAAFACEELIPRLLESEVARSLGEVAILYRTASEGDAAAQAAAQADLPFVRNDNRAPYAKTPLTRWIEDCAAWSAGGWRSSDPRLRDLLRRWTRLSTASRDPRRQRDDSVALVSVLSRHEAGEGDAGEWLEEVTSVLIRPSAAASPTLQSEMDALASMQSALGEAGDLAGWTVARLGGQVGASGSHLNLMTLHSAKGLEFDAVVMLAMDQGIIPSYRERLPRQKHEPRRLFYVGLSRARNEAHLLYSGWRETPWGDIYKEGASEFLLELERRLQA